MAFEKPQLLSRDHLLEGMIRWGRVTKVRTTGCVAASVTYPDRKVQTAYLQVLQRNTVGVQDFYCPEVGEMVWVLHPPAAQSRALILGSTYTVDNPPPYNDKAVRGVVFADGTYVIYDTRGGGNYQIHTPGKVNVNSNSDVNVIATGNVVVQSSATATVKGTTVILDAPNVKCTGIFWTDFIKPYAAGETIATPHVKNSDGSGGGT